MVHRSLDHKCGIKFGKPLFSHAIKFSFTLHLLSDELCQFTRGRFWKLAWFESDDDKTRQSFFFSYFLSTSFPGNTKALVWSTTSNVDGYMYKCTYICTYISAYVCTHIYYETSLDPGITLFPWEMWFNKEIKYWK